MDIRFIRLVTGEELVSEVVDAGDNLILKNPVQMFIQMPKTVDPTGQTGPGVALAPWGVTMYTMLGKDNPSGIPVKKIHVMWDNTKVPPQVEAEYEKLFAKIVTPKSTLIIP